MSRCYEGEKEGRERGEKKERKVNIIIVISGNLGHSLSDVFLAAQLANIFTLIYTKPTLLPKPTVILNTDDFFFLYNLKNPQSQAHLIC